MGIVVFHAFYYSAPERINALEILSLQAAGLSALSGFLFSQKTIASSRDFYIKNFKKIIFPALLTVGMLLVLDLVLVLILRPASWSCVFWSSDNARGSFALQVGCFWYLPYILICYLITPCLNRLDKKTNWLWIGLALAAEYAVNLVAHVRVQILPYIVGFFIGKRAFSKYNQYSGRSWLRAGLWLMVLALFWVIRTLALSWESVVVDMIFPLFDTVVSVSALFCFVNLFSFINTERSARFFQYTDKIAYYIYLFNLFLFCGITNLTKTALSPVGLCLVSVLIVAVMSVLAEALMRLLSRPVKTGRTE